jgi:hypothetical protein
VRSWFGRHRGRPEGSGGEKGGFSGEENFPQVVKELATWKSHARERQRGSERIRGEKRRRKIQEKRRKVKNRA